MKGLARCETSKNEIPIFSRVSFDKRCSKLVHNYFDRTPLPPFDFTNRGCTNIWIFFLNPRIIPNKNQIQNCFLIFLEYIVIFFALLTISSTLWGCKEEAPLKGSIKPSSRSREKMDLILPKQTHFDISLYLQISRVVIITKHISIHQIDSRRTTNREINRKFSLVLYSIKIIPYI